MNIDTTQREWHYLAGLQPAGPVSLDELAALIAAGTLNENVLIATKDAARWRPASEVLKEVRSDNLSKSHLPPLSYPPISLAPPKPSRSLLEHIEETLQHVAGTEKLEGFSLGEMFSEAFKKRTVAEMEEYIIVGTEHTTPKICDVQTGWPKPWLFMRLFLFVLVIYAGFVMAFNQFHNLNLIPGLIMVGAFAMPFSQFV